MDEDILNDARKDFEILPETVVRARVAARTATPEERAEAQRYWDSLTDDQKDELAAQVELDLL